MKAKLEIEISSFMVPHGVNPVQDPESKREGLSPATVIPLGELDPTTLWKLCEDFKVGVYKKAGKQMPPEEG